MVYGKRAIAAAVIAAGCQEQGFQSLPDAQDDRYGQTESLTVISRSPEGRPTFVIGRVGTVGVLSPDDDLLAAEAKTAIGAYLSGLKVEASSLEKRRVTRDRKDGSTHIRYRQYHDGIEVLGAELNVHIDESGVIFAVNGPTRVNLPHLTARISADEAAQALKAQLPEAHAFVARGLRYSATESEVHLIHLLDATHSDGRIYRTAHVDAVSGQVVHVFDPTHDARNREVYNAHLSTSLPGTLAATEANPSTSDSQVLSVFQNVGKAYDAVLDVFGRDSYDDGGGTIRATANYGADHCNAHFTGYYEAVPPGYKRILAFGSGDYVSCQPLGGSLDVVGHEYGHWIEDDAVGLDNSGEPNAIDEHLADVFGAVVESWVDGGSDGDLPVTASTWKIGEDSVSGGFRNMCTPTHNFWTSATATTEEHAAAGVGNLAFCLSVRGGSHPNGATHIPVTGIGLDVASEIWYRAMRDYLTSTSNYSSLRISVEQAAINSGSTPEVVSALGCAFAAVGVGSPPANCQAEAVAPCRTAPPRVPPGGVRKRADIAEVWEDANTTTSVSIYPSSGSGLGPFANWTIQNGGFAAKIRFAAGDFDNDGDQDLASIWNQGGYNSIVVRKSSGSSFSTSTWAVQQGGWSDWTQWLPGDFNNDGRTDLASAWNDAGWTSVAVYLSTGSGFSTPVQWAYRDGGWSTATKWNVGDFDNDGRDDLVAIWNSGGLNTLTVRKSTGSSFAVQHWAVGQGGWNDTTKWLVGDFDGNGKSDVASAWNSGNNVSLATYLSNGTSFGAPQHWLSSNGFWGDDVRWTTGDVDADGKTDVIAAWNDAGLTTLTVRRSTGSAFQAGTAWSWRARDWQYSASFCAGTFDAQ